MKSGRLMMVAMGATLVWGSNLSLAASVGQSFEFPGFVVNFYGENRDGGTFLGASLQTIYEVERVTANLYPDYWDTSRWYWNLNVSGWLDRTATTGLMSTHSSFSRAGVTMHQFNGLDHWETNKGPQDFAWGNLQLWPATVHSANFFYYEWTDSDGPVPPGGGPAGFSANYYFSGRFPSAEIGAAFFGIPEPATAALLVGGAPLFRRRRS